MFKAEEGASTLPSLGGLCGEDAPGQPGLSPPPSVCEDLASTWGLHPGIQGEVWYLLYLLLVLSPTRPLSLEFLPCGWSLGSSSCFLSEWTPWREHLQRLPARVPQAPSTQLLQLGPQHCGPSAPRTPFPLTDESYILHLSASPHAQGPC